MAATVLQFNTATIGGSSIKTDLDGITLSLEADTVENHGLVDDMVSEQVSKLFARLEVPLMSTLSTPERVSDLQLSACTLGGEDMIADYGVESLSLNIAYQQKDVPNAGGKFKVRQNIRKNISGSIVFAVPDDGSFPQLGNMASTTYTDRVKSLSFTINGVTTTLPVLLKKVQLAGQKDGLQMVTAEFGPRKPTSGAYPSAPTGTTSLFEKALNAFRVALEVVLSNTASTGKVFTGDMIFAGLSLEVRDGALVMANYSFDSTGTFAITDAV